MLDRATRAPQAPAASGLKAGITLLKMGLTLLRRLADILALLLLAYMACTILAQIIGRYFFNYSIAWTEETATFAQVWLTLLGAGIAMRYNQHVGVDFLIRKAPLWIQRLFQAAGLVLGVWFLGVVVVGSTSMLAIGFMVKSPALQIPMAVPYFALPVGFGYFLLEFALATLPRVFDPMAGAEGAAEAEA
ncbi:TRAP transporter small permease [Pseudooceanicola sp. CBS1P-1]|uniref:TRAP transporter small permease protein n=1 Tax=Pseudooceanicola albus TaxID=2692189 RepID=A0A6L7GAR1_9RHOB|nr:MULTISPECIES: TRAP transporter small permease [Pseudooceanicola]MBT9386646.1 TRAP transporter small permease [Pseudooceanicola endophyticus]MXN20762.1 TRAP transporter small permease subunit [Pseudooceanicola albus]